MLTKWTHFASAVVTAFAILEVETPGWRAASAKESPSRVTRWTANRARTADSRHHAIVSNQRGEGQAEKAWRISSSR